MLAGRPIHQHPAQNNTENKMEITANKNDLPMQVRVALRIAETLILEKMPKKFHKKEYHMKFDRNTENKTVRLVSITAYAGSQENTYHLTEMERLAFSRCMQEIAADELQKKKNSQTC